MSQLLSDKTAFATPLLLYAYNLIGDDLFELEPETIEQILRQRNKHVLSRNIDRINAAISLITTNLFWQDPITFAVTCRTLNRAARVNAAPPDLDDVLWGITEARLITGNPEDDPEKFTDSIQVYIQQLLKMDSIVTPVPTLDFIVPEQRRGEYEDPDQSIAIFSNSEDKVTEMEQEVNTKLVTLLKQIKDLHIKLSDDAADDLEKLLKNR